MKRTICSVRHCVDWTWFVNRASFTPGLDKPNFAPLNDTRAFRTFQIDAPKKREKAQYQNKTQTNLRFSPCLQVWQLLQKLGNT